MDKLQLLIKRKRALMNLPEIPLTSEAFLSDVRHLLICSFLCNQYELDGEEGNMRFTNLESVDKDKAVILQRKFEEDHGLFHEQGLADILDHKEKRIVEITITSGDLDIAIMRKRRRQRETTVIAISENLDPTMYKCSQAGYARAEIEEAIENANTVWIQHGFPYKLNTRGSTKEREPIKVLPIVDSIMENIEMMKKVRDPNEVLKKIALNKDIRISQRGLKMVDLPQEGKILWIDPYMKANDIMETGERDDYGEFIMEFLSQCHSWKGNGKDFEERICKWMNNLEIELSHGECCFNERIEVKSFGEKVKKAAATIEEVIESGDTFLLQDGQDRTTVKDLDKKWRIIMDEMINGGDKNVKMTLEKWCHRIRTIGEVASSLHRNTTQRIIRPLQTDGQLWGLMFKSRSKFGSHEKEGKLFMITFQATEYEEQNTFLYGETQLVWRLDTVMSRGDWNTARMLCYSKRHWSEEYEYKEDKIGPMLHPYERRIVMRSFSAGVNLDSMYHLTDCFQGTAISEAMSGTNRKMTEILRAIQEGRTHGGIPYTKMSEDMEEMSKTMQRPSDFRQLHLYNSLCEQILKKM